MNSQFIRPQSDKNATKNPLSSSKSESGNTPIFFVFILGCILSFGAFFLVEEAHENDRGQNFRRAAFERISNIKEIINSSLETLYAIRGLYSASTHVDRQEFHKFVDAIELRPGIKALEWVPRVTFKERASYEQSVRDNEILNFQILERDKEGKLIKAGKRKEYFPVHYVEPYVGNESNIGFDVAYNPIVLNALNKARDTGKPAATSKINLMQETEEQYGFLLIVPIYQNGQDTVTLQQRRKNLEGFALSVLSVKGLFSQLSSEEKSADASLSVSIFDTTISDQVQVIYPIPLLSLNISKPSKSAINSIKRFEIADVIEVGGREWQVRLSPLNISDFSERGWLSWATLVAGFIITVLIILYIRSFTTRSRTIERLVEERTNELTVATQELKSAESRIRAVVDTVVDGIITIDEFGEVQAFNPSAERIFGYEKFEVLGQNVNMLMPEPYKRDHDGFLRSYRETGNAKIIGMGREVEGRRKDGSTFHLDLAVNAMEVNGRRMFTGIVRDITERKLAEKKLHDIQEVLDARVLVLEQTRTSLEVQAAQLLKTSRDLEKEKDKAEAATSAKSEFLANMSHEIRTPMNGIMGMTELLLDTGLNDQQKRYASTVLNSADSLLGLINDILDFSKIESGKLELDPIPFDLRLMVEDVAEVLAVRAHEKAVDMIARFAEGTPEYVIGDGGRIRQMLYNLAGNAIKFTEHGFVSITVEAIEGNQHSPDQVVIRVSVKDTGIGIPLDQQDVVFEKFKQADASTTRKFGGTGLGLAICKQLSELMGGEIGVESQPGQGSTFWFTMVLGVEQRTKTHKPDAEILRNVKALIVDDIQINCEILKEYLSTVGVNCKTCCSPTEALACLKSAHNGGAPFQVVLLDYMMPEMDGEMLTRAIKTDGDLKDTIVVIQSSTADKGCSKRFANAGAAAFLSKPIRKAQIVSTLALAWQAKKNQQEIAFTTGHVTNAVRSDQEPEGSERPFRGVRILLAEDNRVNREFAIEMLGNLGCEVVAAENGRIAVEAVTKEPFDLIFMDCQMPEMDGFAASQVISGMKAKNQIADIPIIALTANAMKGDKEKCLAAGMSDYLSKPVRKKTIIEAISRWVAQSIEPIVSDGSGINSTVEEPDRDDRALALDMEIVEDAKSSMKAKFPTMVDYFLEDSSGYMSQIEAALANNKVTDMAAPAHTLKSSSKLLGAMQVSELATKLEETVHEMSGDEVEDVDISSLVSALRTALDVAKPHLRQCVIEDVA